MLAPVRCIGIAAHWRRVGQFEKGEDISHARVEEDMHVGVGRLGGGYLVLSDGADQIHVEQPAIEIDGFLRVPAPKGDVMKFFDQHGTLLSTTIGSREKPAQNPRQSGEGDRAAGVRLPSRGQTGCKRSRPSPPFRHAACRGRSADRILPQVSRTGLRSS